MGSNVLTPNARCKPHVFRAVASGPLGRLSKLPLEIREQIYGTALWNEDIEINTEGQVRSAAPLLLASKIIRREALRSIPFYAPVIIHTPKALLDLARKLINIFGDADEGQLLPRPTFPRHLRLKIFNPETMRLGCLGEITETGAWYTVITAIPAQRLSSVTFHFHTTLTMRSDKLNEESKRRNVFVTTLLCRLGLRSHRRIPFFVHALEGDYTQRLADAFNKMWDKPPEYESQRHSNQQHRLDRCR